MAVPIQNFNYSAPAATPEQFHLVQSYCEQIANFLTENPSAWTQHTSARTADGVPTCPRDERARSWCAFGLIERFISDSALRNVAARLLSRSVTGFNRPPLCAPEFNDHRGRKVEEVIRMFRAASYLPHVEEYIQAPPQQWFATVEEVNAIEVPKVPAPSDDFWNTVAHGDISYLNEAALDDMLKKLVPWPTIMRQLTGSVAA